MKNLVLDGEFASLSRKDTKHPGLRTAKIVYLDDQPNSNGYGVKYEDFEEIKNTVIGTPVKMKFMGAGVSGHQGSIPIGHIRDVEELEVNGIHQLVIDTILYADDYPDEIEWLEAALEEGKNDPTKIPGVSFEMTYHDTLTEGGIKWLKGLVARAATFVRTPAYGNRTALLALAADKTLTADTFIKELSALINDNSPKIPVKGGSNMTEEEITALKDELEALKTALAEKTTEVESKNTEIETLTSDKEVLQVALDENKTALAEYRSKETLDTRKAALEEAGISVEINPDRILGMAEEEFTAYVGDLKAVAESMTKKDTKEDKKIALASSHQRLPKFDVSNDKEPVSAVDLKSKLKNISRSSASDEETE